jgi:hypothetical protein
VRGEVTGKGRRKGRQAGKVTNSEISDFFKRNANSGEGPGEGEIKARKSVGDDVDAGWYPAGDEANVVFCQNPKYFPNNDHGFRQAGGSAVDPRDHDFVVTTHGDVSARELSGPATETLKHSPEFLEVYVCIGEVRAGP